MYKMDGLIIKREWLDLIISGRKTLEIRGCNTKKVKEKIYLLSSPNHRIMAECIIKAAYPISCSDWSEERENHCVDIPYPELKKRYNTPYAWVLSEVKPIKDIWFYNHPKGAVIWVKNVKPEERIGEVI